VEEKALRFVAKTADGSMRDALSLLDQCIAFHYGKELTYEDVLDILGAVDTEVFSGLLRKILDKDVLGCIRFLEEIIMQGRELTQFVTDFTWYLRNLLLVKTSDNMEDAIDISRENLQRLKEEAVKIDLESIFRYIRIFSETASKLKYASGKRILLEVTLIKLCKPEMETKTDSLAERIRTLEDKMEKGMVPAVAVEYGTVQNRGEGSLAEEGQKPVLPKAIPEEIKTVVQRWSQIVNMAGMPMKIHLRKARLSLGGENRLVMVLEDGVDSDYFLRQEGHKEILEEMINESIGKKVDLEIQSLEENRRFEASYIDLSKVINIEIEEEE
jgi:DNA polymerase-3 subunit gamma/tau